MDEFSASDKDEMQSIPPSVDYEKEFHRTIRYGNKTQVNIIFLLKNRFT